MIRRKGNPRVKRVLGLWLLCLCVAGSGLGLAQESRDRVLIKIFESDPEAKTTSYSLATNELHIEPPSGYVELIRDNTTLEAKQVDYAQESQVAVLQRDVKVTDPEIDLWTDKLTVQFNDDLYIAEGKVRLMQWEVDAQGERGAQELYLTADKVTINDAAKTVQAQGRVYVEEADRRVWSETMDYDQQREIMVFTGDVRMETESGNRLQGNRVVVDLATDEVTVFGPVTGEFILETEEEAEPVGD